MRISSDAPVQHSSLTSDITSDLWSTTSSGSDIVSRVTTGVMDCSRDGHCDMIVS